MSEQDVQSPARSIDEIKKEMDTLCERIAACVPKRPYLMSVDVRPSYDPPPMLANNWKYHCAFHREYEQYQTLLYRDPGENSLLSLSAQMDEQSKADAKSYSNLISTPKLSATKKLSLEEYKKKKESQASRPASSQGASQKSEPDKRTPDSSKAVVSHVTNDAPTSQPKEASHVASQKRSLKEYQEGETSKNTEKEPVPPSKKPRTSNQPVETKEPHTDSGQPARTSNSTSSKAKVTSAHEPKHNSHASKPQPIDFSPPWTTTVNKPGKKTHNAEEDKDPPWLPDVDLASISHNKLKIQMSASLTHTTPNEPSLSRLWLPVSPKGEAPPTSGKGRIASKALDAHPKLSRNEPTIRVEAKVVKSQTRDSSLGKVSAANKAQPSTPKSKASELDSAPKTSSKPSEKRVKNDADQTQGSAQKQARSIVNDVEKKKASSPTPASKRRVKEEEPVNEKPIPKKRPKLEDKDRESSPRTPKIVVSQPSAASPASTQKSLKVSPGSRPDTSHGKTSPDAETPKASLSAVPNTDGAGNTAAWSTERQRVQALGKRLKKDSSNTIEASRTAKTAEEKSLEFKLAAVQAIEGLVCFTQLFAIEDHLKPRHFKEAIQRWDSMLPWAKGVSAQCAQYPTLRAYTALLRSACLSRLVAEYGKYPAEELTKAGNDVHQKVVEGLRELTRLTGEYNKTLLPSLDKGKFPQTLAEAHHLPIGMIMKPLAIARFGITLLEEWTKCEKVLWKKSYSEGMSAQL